MWKWLFGKKADAPRVSAAAIQPAVIAAPQKPLVYADPGLERAIEFIIIHCSATRVNVDIGAKELRDIHMKPKSEGGRGWREIGYHYVIRRNGVIELGRDLDGDGQVDDDVGAHAYGWNNNSIGICLIGGAGPRGQGEANFTKAQLIALRAFLVAKMEQYPVADVIGHRDTGAIKDCPSFNVKHWLMTGELIEPRNIAR